MSLIDTLSDRLKLHESYQRAFRGEDGERVIRHLMSECGLLNPKIIVDPNTLLVRQGQQHIVLSILRIIGKDKNSIVKQIEQSLLETINQ